MESHPNLNPQPRLSEDIENIATRHLDLDLIEEDFMNVTAKKPLTDTDETEYGSDSEAPRVDPRNRKLTIPDLDSETSFPSLGASKGPTPLGSNWGARPSNGTNPSPASLNKNQNLVIERFTLPLLQSPQATSQLRETIQKAQKRFSVSVDVSSSRLSGTSTFIIKGRPEHVAKAEREIKAGLLPKKTITVNVPTEVIGFVLGAKGRNLAQIQKRTLTTIDVPRRDQESEGESYLQVAITGDQSGVLQAKKEIAAIVREKESKKVFKFRDIPTMFYPLIAGADGSRIHEYVGETGVEVEIPFLVGLTPQEFSRTDTAIVITGRKEAAEVVIDRIRKEHERLVESISELTLAVSKPKHSFLIGPKGKHFSEILAASGCIVELPAANDPSDKVTLRGASENLVAALTVVMSKATSAHAAVIDVARLHAADSGYYADLFSYLANSAQVRSIESKYQAQIYIPSPDQQLTKLDIVGQHPGNVAEAKATLEEAIKALSPERFGHVDIPVELHGFVAGPNGEKLTKFLETHGVQVFLPTAEISHVVLVAEKGKSVAAAVKALKASIAPMLDITEQVVQIPAQVHRHIIGPNGTTLERTIGAQGEATVVVRFGSEAAGGEKCPRHLFAESLGSNQVLVRGPKAEVARVVAELEKQAVEMQDYEKAMNYTTSFVIPSKHSAHVVGKGGANIQRLKDQYDIKIDVERKGSKEDDTVKITGLQKNADAAKKEVLAMVERLRDQIEERLRVPHQFHIAVIGPKGRYVHRLEEKYGVVIKFPRISRSDDEGSDEDRPAALVGRDEIYLRGGRKGVADAKAEILEAVEYERENSFKLTFRVERRFLPHILGRNGANVNDLKAETNCRIDVENDGDEAILTLQGTRKGTKEAQKKILEMINAIQAKVTQELQIKYDFHRPLIGPRGSKLRATLAACQGVDPNSVEALASMVRFPKDKSDTVVVTGDSALVEKVCAVLLKEAQRLEEHVTIEVSIAPEHHSSLIGRGGATLRSVIEKYGVEIHFPRRNVEGEAASLVTISGQEADCEAARTDLLLRLPGDVRVTLPKREAFFLTALGRCTPRKLKQEFNISAECPNIPAPAFVGQGDVARIDDETSHVACLTATFDDDSDIEWVLKGAKPALEKAQAFINKQLRAIRDYKVVLRLYVPEACHRLVIGRQGNTVNQLRAESSCEIELPSSNSKRRFEASAFGDGVAIVIVGASEGAETAKRRILEIVDTSKPRN
ncbi:hypothetical protein L0F63_004328 [Massospora cicadina]|nr:hypothetical protein L0F63_004328 [Massospora cicadina]